MRLSDFDYELPDELIARYPAEKREGSRLLVVHRSEARFEDRSFPDILEYLNEGDCLVLNDTKVIPARLNGVRETTGAQVEIFLNQRMQSVEEEWHALAGPAKKAKVGEYIRFSPELRCLVVADAGPGEKIVRFEFEGDFLDRLSEVGAVPLPPYFKRDPEESDKTRYQTVYATQPGAVAAPTAGLHFTPELLSRAEAKGVKIARITLHTGLGTFKPVEVEEIAEHKMHYERYSVSAEAAEIINQTRAKGGRVVPVGTTSVRTLETIAESDGTIEPRTGDSNIFIYPPYRFKTVDAMITNFHMPRSTLLMMISAFMGHELMRACYEHALKERYRFFSYGDAMLIL
jgi:S-adenosylmethionine:tRNA ribosyltransferase-isomerase